VQAATTWRAGRFSFDLVSGVLVGIVNVTPDSFSDGGEFLDVDAAISHGLSLYESGAGLIDIGGESTRPGSHPVTAQVETERILPVVAALASRGVPVSVDTSKASVAAAAISAGACAVNDVTGFSAPEMVEVCVANRVGAVVMHMLGEPRTMQSSPRYQDVVAEVRAFLEKQARRLVEAGLDPEAIVVDPGFGFGKTTSHNLQIIAGLSELVTLGYPVMLGTSRKSTLAAIAGSRRPADRDGLTAITTALAYERGARIFRVHNVHASRDALQIAAAIVEPQTWEEWQQD
jgi:dihydropteroate synthase